MKNIIEKEEVDLSAEVYVVTTATYVELYVTKEEANRVAKLWKANPASPIQVRHAGGVAVAIVRAVDTAQQKADARRVKRGEWKCKHGVWHQPGEPCRCYTPRTEYIPKKVDPSPGKWAFCILYAKYRAAKGGNATFEDLAAEIESWRAGEISPELKIIIRQNPELAERGASGIEPIKGGSR